MSNLVSLALLLLVIYFVPLLLVLYAPRIWSKLYFALVVATVAWLSYQIYDGLRTEADCRAGCAIAIGAWGLVAMMLAIGTSAAPLSVWGVSKVRAWSERKRLRAARSTD